jgi:carboxylate-amine ligase
MSAPGSATPLAIACLYRALARQPERNAGLTAVDRAIAVENKWIAQRYGVHGTFAGGLGPQTVAELLEEIIAHDCRRRCRPGLLKRN